MIVEEYNSDRTRVLHYSDKGVYIKQNETNALYVDANDVVPCIYTYEETDIPATAEEATTEDYAEQLERFGVE